MGLNRSEYKELLTEIIKGEILDELKEYINKVVDEKLKGYKNNDIKDDVYNEVAVTLDEGIKPKEIESRTISDNEDFYKKLFIKNFYLNDNFVHCVKENLERANKITSKNNAFMKALIKLNTPYKNINEISKHIIYQNKFNFERQNTKDCLINNPVKNYEEFVERLKHIDPSTNEETLAFIDKHNPNKDMDEYNSILLQIYESKQKELIDKYLICCFDEEKNKLTKQKGKNLLGEYMDKNGIKPQWLANETGISRSTIVSICNNPNQLPTVDKAQKICRALKVDLDVIFPLMLEENTEEDIESELPLP